MFRSNQAEAANALGIKQPQINRWLSTSTASPRKISEISARQIEERLNLKSNALDKYLDSEWTDQRQVIDEFAWVYQNVSESGRAFLLVAIEAAKTTFVKDTNRAAVDIEEIAKHVK